VDLWAAGSCWLLVMPFFPTHNAIIIINSFNSLTPLVADMRPSKLLAS
jgi:hypothetical protein